MRTFVFLLLAAAVAASLPGAMPIPGDSRAGADVFQKQKCVECHSINGKGGTSAPDLARAGGRNLTPSLMASLLWNHAPTMWGAMSSAGIPLPRLSADQTADLFAYFYSVRYFEQPGDAGRGKQVFQSKRCGECHGLAQALGGGAKPVAEWKSLGDPVLLAQEMWNHSATMRAALGRKNIPWPVLTSQELTDLILYLQNAPEVKGRPPVFAPASAETGKMLFELKGCAECHVGKNSLEDRFANRTVTDFAVAMWNHAPKMKQPAPELRAEEMRRIVGYLWSRQLFEQAGSAAKGKSVYAAKKCGTCHDAGIAPGLTDRKEPLNALSMTSALWQHGPAMLKRIREQNLAWPRFDGGEMADLLAYLNRKQ